MFELVSDLPADHPDRERQQRHFLSLELMMLDDLSPENLNQVAGIMSRFGFSQAKLAKIKEKKAAQNFRNYLLLVLINEALDRVDELIAYHAEEIDRLLEEIENTSDQLEELEEDHRFVSDAIIQYQDEGVIEINEGVKNAIRTYEGRTGLQNVLETGDLYENLLAVKVDIEQEQALLSDTLASKNDEFSFHAEQKEALLTIRETLKSGSPDEQADALYRLEEIENTTYEPVAPTNDTTTLEQTRLTHPSLDSESSIASAFSFDFEPLDETNNLPEASEKIKKQPVLPQNMP